MSEETQKPRYGLLDTLRGLCVLSMVCYHAMYDLVYAKGVWIPWFPDTPGYVWQQSICWTFILLSGLCQGLSRRHVPHGLVLVGCGCLVSLVTGLVMPQEAIRYGVLTLLGLAALLLYAFGLLGKRLRLKLPAWAGLVGAAALFFLTRGVPQGYLGFEGLRLFELPSAWYRFDLLAVFGFPSPAFVSSDYFPLIPWFFLYLAGYFLWGLLKQSEKARDFLVPGFRPLAFLGRHSLFIYLLHQPVLMLIFSVFIP